MKNLECDNVYSKNWGTLLHFLQEDDLNGKQRGINLREIDLANMMIQNSQQRAQTSSSTPISPNTNFNQTRTSLNQQNLQQRGQIKRPSTQVGTPVSNNTSQIGQKILKMFDMTDNESKPSSQYFAMRNFRKQVIITSQRAQRRVGSCQVSPRPANSFNRIQNNEDIMIQQYDLSQNNLNEMNGARSSTKPRLGSQNLNKQQASSNYGSIMMSKRRLSNSKTEDFENSRFVQRSNYLQRAIRKTADDNKNDAGRVDGSDTSGQATEKTYGPKAQFTRMHSQLHKRVDLTQEIKITKPQVIDIPKEFQEQIDKAKPNNKLQNLMGITPTQYICHQNTSNWMKKRNINQEKFLANKSNIQFARELFSIWDEDQSGKLEVDEVSLPLIALGLSTDSLFVKKLLRAIDAEKFFNDVQKITIKDFAKIFKKDHISDLIIQKIKQTVDLQCQKDNNTLNKQSSIREQEIQGENNDLENWKEINNQSNNSIKENILMQPNQIMEQQYNITQQQTKKKVCFQDQEDHQSQVNNSKTRKLTVLKMQKINNIKKSTYNASKTQDLKIQANNKIYGLNEQIAVIRNWWEETDQNRGNFLQSIEDVSKMFVSKGLASESDTASRIIWTAIKERKQFIDWDDFNQIFCKSIFREVLVSLASNILKIGAKSTSKSSVPLQQKLNNYQRSLMFQQLENGLVKDVKEKQQDVKRPILSSLYQFKQKNGTLGPPETYQQFLNDPMGLKKKMAQDERFKNVRLDDFIQSIKLQEVAPNLSLQQVINDLDQQVKEHFSYGMNINKKDKILLNELNSVKNIQPNYPNWNRAKEVEVKIPGVYKVEIKNERDDKQSNLLQKFQEIIDRAPNKAMQLMDGQESLIKYSLLEQDSNQWYKSLLECTDNHQYIPVVLQNCFVSEFNEYLKGQPESELDQIKSTIISLAQKYSAEPIDGQSLLMGIYAIFIRENCTGPSVYTLYVEETLEPLVKGGPLPPNDLDPLSNKNQALQKKLLQHFEKDSEQLYAKTQFLVLFYAMEVLLNHEGPNYSDLNLWKARFAFLYNQQLTSSVSHLKDDSINYYESHIKNVKEKGAESVQNKQALALLLVEQSYCYLNFYKYKQAKSAFKEAMSLTGLSLKLTGRLGRRTKYQEFDIAQLVLDVENREVEVKQPEQDPTQESQKVLLEEDTILYETPLITDTLGDLQNKDLSVVDQIIILAYINYVHHTHAKDETRDELLRPYINVAVQKSNNWLVLSKGLLLRSRNEFDKSKTKERSLMQVQQLIDQFRAREPCLGQKIAYYNATNYPLFWELQKELAKSYMSMGVFVSAYELLKEVELYEDSILCLFMAGRKTQAEALANECLQNTNSPAILCLLGDMKREVQYYIRAWDESGHKFARAMRSLARIQFFTGEYLKAVESYEKALAINKLYPEAWFTMGCAYMRMENFKGAVYAFGTSISIDESQAEAWCNLSTCYMKQDKNSEAVVCLEQAIKKNRRNWKIWENYIILSIETLQFHKALSGARELIRQDKIERVNVNLMLKICDVFLKNYFVKQGIAPEEFAIQKRQLYRFFDEYTNKIAKDWQVWRLIGRIKTVLQESNAEIKELKLKEIRALCAIGWENEIDTCEKLERSLEELVKIYEKVERSEEEKVFMVNIIKAIEDCVHRECKVKI